MFQELQFREYYSRLADDELARIALENELVPEAQRALSEELQKRGLTDLSKYNDALTQAAEIRPQATGTTEPGDTGDCRRVQNGDTQPGE